MKIIVFGGTGSIGRLVVDQALEEGHQVTVFTRDGSKVEPSHPHLQVAGGNVLDTQAITPAIAGQDAVVVTLGAGSKGGVRGPGTGAIIEAMQQTGVRRLIVQSTLGVGDSRPNLNFIWKRLMFGLLLREVYQDHIDQEARTRASGLDWTIVRPGSFTDGPRTGSYARGFGPEVKVSLKVSRADIAEFIVQQLTDDTWLRQTPALAYA